MSGTVEFTRSVIIGGSGGRLVEVECRLSNNLPTIVIVGSAGRPVSESTERIRGAFAASQILLPRKRITINLAPADLPKSDSGLDLAIAAAIYQQIESGSRMPDQLRQQAVFVGELSLDGRIRPVRGIIGRLLAAKAAGLTAMFVPTANLEQARLITGVSIYPADNLRQLFGYWTGQTPLQPIMNSSTEKLSTSTQPPRIDDSSVLLSDIAGQAEAKRALLIAAAGGHNLLMTGPPGTGKTMLAKAMRSLLPAMNQTEVLEVTQLHSLSSQNFNRVVTSRPFRSPHHSASRTAIIGGGNLKPGEISLAHNGILFLDELPEYNRDVIESMRQPLEEKHITITRAKDSAEFPANFILLATANPCPCGFYQSSKSNRCRCTPYDITKYQSKLSGPIMDRIDLCCYVETIEHNRLLLQRPDSRHQQQVLKQITSARTRQIKRNRLTTDVPYLNAQLSNRQISNVIKLPNDAKSLLDQAAKRLDLSARAYVRTLKVAQTIADLEQADQIIQEYIAEALAYRQRSDQQ